MTPGALKALRGSIKKWQSVVAGTMAPTDALSCHTCPLCHLFHDKSPGWCQGCPVKLTTGLDTCQGTPFYDYHKAVKHNDSKAMTAAARAELAFLRSLLPRPKRKTP